MAVKFPLKMSDGTPVRTMEELREHFDLAAVLNYYSSGRLKEWLSDRYYDVEAEKVEHLDSSSENFKKSLCDILGVVCSEDKAIRLDLNDIAKKNERREQLKQYTADDKILSMADNVAFTQKELKQLLKKMDALEADEDGNKVIYLCGEHFIIPGNIGGIIYKGINNPTAEFDGEAVEAGIDLQGVEFNIGDYIDDGEYGAFNACFRDNPILGAKLLQKSAEQGNAEAQCFLGICYETGNGLEKNMKEAVKWYRKSAEQGNERAQCFLGMCYLNGEGIEENYDEAIKWVRESAEQDYETAKVILGAFYGGGIGVERNFLEAAKWLREAAEQGDADVQNQLNEIAEEFTEINEEIVRRYKEATEQNDPEAQNYLGLCYEEGRGVEPDINEAMEWYYRAAEQGHAEASKNYNRCFHGILNGLSHFRESLVKCIDSSKNNS